MRAHRLIIRVAIVLLLFAGSARGDRIELKNGSVLRGKIVTENRSEIELELEDGMKMVIRRSMIKSIDRDEEEAEPNPEPGPVPEGRPEVEPPPVVPVGPDPTPAPADPKAPPFFERSPHAAWDLDYGRYPTLTGAKLTRFRAYKLVEMNPLAISPTDPRFAPVVREHGHGGFLAAWTFRYVGNKDIRFGDKVKFVGELTSPADPEASLLRLLEGPAPTATRLSVILIRRESTTLRFVTPTVFDGGAFKQRDVTALSKLAMPVRTYDQSFREFVEQWVLPSRSAILSGLDSPFGETPAVKVERYRFRLDWYAKAPEDRPSLDPSLLARESIRPLAMPGRPVATELQVRKHWGTAEINRERLKDVLEQNRKALLHFGIRPGAAFYVEMDRIGALGAKGVSLTTRRLFIDKATIDGLTRQ